MSAKIGPQAFDIGARVHCCKGTQIGTITEIEQGGSALVPKWVYGVKFDNGNSTAVYADSLVPVAEMQVPEAQSASPLLSAG